MMTIVRMSLKTRLLIAACCALLTISAAAPGYEAALQVQCGTVTAISDPVDTSVFRLIQDFGVASPRHQGRYHTGEDYFGGREMIGQPVYAAADGRVTYSSPRGWGRDGGVVIIEHTLQDGRILYSMYGHMIETGEITFPTRYECISRGEIVGAIGDARPAPHLHFEVRINNPDIPGPGYSWESPLALGFRQPARILTNWRAWLTPAYRWHITLNETTALAAPPLVLNDNSLLYLETPNLLKRATPDGRVLWRVALERRAVGLTGYQGATLLHYADGGVTQVDADGNGVDRWDSTVPVDSAPFAATFPDGEALLFHAPASEGTSGMLVAFNPNRRAVLWTLAEVPPIATIHAAQSVIGVLTQSNELLTVSMDGRLLDRAQLDAPPHLSTASDGALLAYSLGGLWRIDANGVWGFGLETAPAMQQYGAAYQAADGRLFIFDGVAVSAYANGAALWSVPLADAAGSASAERVDSESAYDGRAYGGGAELALVGNVLLLTSTWGQIVTLQPDTGVICGDVSVYGDAFTKTLWSAMGADGTLRLSIGDQILGFDWETLTNACPT